MDYDEELRHQEFDRYKACEARARSRKRLVVIAIIFFAFWLLGAIGGCANIQTCELEAKPIKVKYSCTFE
jgi:hypothetical protein